MIGELGTYVSGTGTGAVVFLHGVFMDRSMWDDVVRQIDARSIRVDMPGHGSSGPMPPRNTLADHVEAVAMALDSLAVTRPIIVGHSWGGMVAIRLAQHRPDLVGGIVLSNVPLRRNVGASRLGFWMQRALLAAGFPLGAYGRLASRSLMGAEYRARRPEAISALETRIKRLGRRQIDRILRSVLLEPGDAIDLVAHLDVPWLAVAGRDDYAIAGGVAGQLRRLGDLHVVEGAHTTPLEQPQAIIDAVEAVRSRIESAVDER